MGCGAKPHGLKKKGAGDEIPSRGAGDNVPAGAVGQSPTVLQEGVWG